MQDIKGVKIIIGLGNPGKEYEKTCHNAGILFIDYLINKIPAEIKNPAKGEIRSPHFQQVEADQERQKSKVKNFEFVKFNFLILANPLTFMNESGKAVLTALKYFSSKKEKIKPEEILIMHEDSSIELGEYKISFGRGSAAHKGVESIIRSLKTKNFWRLRIGISPIKKVTSYKLQVTRTKAEDFVLKKIKKSDWLALQQVFESIIEYIRARLRNTII